MAYPIEWLDTTFSSRSRTEELLRPDVESGLISQHDYQLATAFLPGPQRHWPLGYAVLGSSTTAGYLRYLRRPPASLRSTTLVATVAGFMGAVYGQFRRAEAHWTFTHLLEDPAAFSQALENINKRIGGVGPLGWSIAGAKETVRREDMHGNAPRPAEDAWASQVAQGLEQVSEASTNAVPAPTTPSANPSKPMSRWEQIRAINARNAAQASSWDALRQNHERTRVQDNADRPPEDNDRTREQAEFDALLEAERRVSSGERGA